MNRAEKRRQRKILAKSIGTNKSARTATTPDQNLTPAAQRLLNEAIQAQERGDDARTQSLCQQVLSETPRHAIAMTLLGTATHQLGDPAHGADLLLKAVKAHPNFTQGRICLGNAFMALGHHEDAAKHYTRAAQLDPDAITAHINLGNAQQEMGCWTEAARSYQKALQLNPGAAELHFNYGLALWKLENHESARKAFEHAISIDPDHVDAHMYLGEAARISAHDDLAIIHFRKSQSLRPDDAQIHLKLGVALQQTGEVGEAINCYRRALELDPNYGKAYANWGNALQDTQRLDEAEEKYKSAMAVSPELYDAQNNLSLLQLLRGEYEAGWENYESRFFLETGKDNRVFDRPVWAGQDLTGKSLAILCEQGVGDQILYASLFSCFDLRSTRLVIECEARLLPIFKRSFSDINFVALETPRNAALSSRDIDFQITMGSIVPFLRPTPSTPPSKKSFLMADDTATHNLRQRYLEWSGSRPVVGVSWYSGSKSMGSKKSLSILDWAPILSNKSYAYVSLQYGDVENDLARLEDQTGIKIFHDPEIHALKDMDAFAAQVAAMDLVISISNATVHMSGALGVETWLMLQHISPIWYWHLGHDDSVWYSGFNLFRQKEPNNWEGVIDQVAERLKDRNPDAP
jgi:tetratricopeptide (TPR) repeat protein